MFCPRGLRGRWVQICSRRGDPLSLGPAPLRGADSARTNWPKIGSNRFFLLIPDLLSVRCFALPPWVRPPCEAESLITPKTTQNWQGTVFRPAESTPALRFGFRPSAPQHGIPPKTTHFVLWWIGNAEESVPFINPKKTCMLPFSLVPDLSPVHKHWKCETQQSQVLNAQARPGR